MRKVRFWICALIGIVAFNSAASQLPARISGIDTASLNNFFPDSTIKEIISRASVSLWDSSRLKKLKADYIPDSTHIPSFKSFKSLQFRKPTAKNLIQFENGQINYTWNFRTTIDTPFLENNISQHYVHSSLNLTIAESIPLRVNYYERQSNSLYFRDYRDFKIEFDGPRFKSIQTKKLREHIEKRIDQFEDPQLLPSINLSKYNLESINKIISDVELINKLLQSKQMIVEDSLFRDVSSYKVDSALLNNAKDYINFYENLIIKGKKFKSDYDSTYAIFNKYKRNAAEIKKLINGDHLSEDRIELLKNKLIETGLNDQRILKLINTANAIKTFAIGRTMPNYSELTLKNMNVRGINFEYNDNSLYFAVAAGSVDFRIRDFVYPKYKNPQFVYSARLGIGQKERNNIIATFYKGDKFLYAGTGNSTTSIAGISVSAQLRINKYTFFQSEIAQSSQSVTPNTIVDTGNLKFNFRDPANRAYNLAFKSFFPKTATKFEAFYQYTGINFQSYSNYRTNSQSIRFNIKAEQYFLRKQLHVVAQIRKNDFSNPFVLDRYSSKSIYKNISLSFRRKKWPMISAGYIPSSQLTALGTSIYESHFQILNGSIIYRYPLGITNVTSTILINQYFNSSEDSGFIFYNAKNYFIGKSIEFTLFTGKISYSYTKNGNSNLKIFNVGAERNFGKLHVGFGAKVNHVMPEISKVGLYGSVQMNIERIGRFSCWIDKNYFPGIGNTLVKNELYSIGFTRYFKKM